MKEEGRWQGGSHQLDKASGRLSCRRKQQPTPVFLPGESHGQRSLVGYSPRGRKELDTSERLHLQITKVLHVIWCVTKYQIEYVKHNI